MPQLYKNILLIQLRQLGDILLTTPCIREIKRHNPNAKVTFLCHKMGNLILQENPYMDECFLYDENKDSFRDYLKLIRSIRNKKFDLVLDFMNNPRSALFAFLSGADARVSFQSKRRFFYSDVIPKAKPAEYIVKEKFRLLEAVGISAQDQSLTLPWFEIHTAPLLKFYSAYPEFREKPLRVVLSPTHRREARRWPLESYAQVADHLVREHGAFVSWVWGPGEEAEIDKAMSFCKTKTFKFPPTQFREMAALVANHDLFIGNSNGPSHVAVGVGIHSLQLHGHTFAKSWSPCTDKHVAIQGPVDISQISVASVLEKLKGMLPEVLAERKTKSSHSIKLKWN